ncbi:MAG: Branched-chain amino acid ABC-type transport system, permease component IlvH [Candidatus Methanohalarchaeum thermophilum]|uniref:Branched-chain amino acid ABC-type transport system, permease component IlvH n=1 Tax=Methanohalarchaeum thermophilum TaxID=1903181 RepID=A0A1Q6DXJ0_METT1|nr:MAG: Branched-chain amino acid ABC-type transport system, permease component IlvH [Candidatus Methanohalarchaeum thermophilum]
MIQQLIFGIVTGSIIALGAIGLSMIYDILDLVNFAHGDFMTLGAYLTFLFNVSLNLNLILAAALGIILTGVISLILDKIMWKKLRDKGAGSITLLITAIGLALVIRNLIVFQWGGSNVGFDLPLSQNLNFHGIMISTSGVLTVVVAALLMIALDLILRKTKIGKAMRALSDNKNLARITGINVDNIILWTWGIGTSFAAVGGVLYGLNTVIRPDMGWFLLLPIFAAVILGGIGNPYGAMVGGLIIGISQEMSTIILPSSYKIAVSFVILILVMLIKPEGIFGEK